MMLGERAPSSDEAVSLVLYDASGPWAHLGELYAIQLVNLASHFGPWRAKLVERYASSDADGVRAVLYIGSTHGEPLPRSFVDHVLADRWPVLWIGENVWQLIERYPFFTERYGWVRGRPDVSPVGAVRYRQTDLPRDPAAQPEGIATFRFVDERKVTIVAEAVRADGTTIPWAVRSSNLVYVAENPFRYTSDADRQLILADLLFDLLAPDTPVRHRALLRLEDINPRSDPAELRALGERLAARAIPFGFALYPVHRAPGEREVRLCERPAVVAAIRALIALGGTMVAHGFSHQYGAARNPYNGRSGDDYEFFRAALDERGEPRLLGPVDGDTRPGRTDASPPPPASCRWRTCGFQRSSKHRTTRRRRRPTRPSRPASRRAGTAACTSPGRCPAARSTMSTTSARRSRSWCATSTAAP
jgi:uncharacterized protein YdaL